MNTKTEKESVHEFWNENSCGEQLYLSSEDQQGYANQLKERYRLEPFIPAFAEFSTCGGKQLLEIGVGLGADHQSFAEAGAVMHGVDLTERAISHTKRRFEILGLKSALRVGDAENLPFEKEQFDVVYSWGVLHHSPNTPSAIQEVLRVLKPGGSARIMIYYKYSLIGLMLWFRYGLMRFRPFMSLAEVYSKHLESPGTKAYTYREAEDLFEDFDDIEIDSVLTHGDLLTSAAGQRHRGPLLTIARRIWPRWFFKTFFGKNGLFLMIKATKSAS